MSGNHRTDPNTISILRTATLNKTDDIRRTKSLAYRVMFLYKDSKIKFPMLKSIRRAS